MSYFWTCPYCEANLDPGEKCECQEQKEETNGNNIQQGI